MNEDKEDDLNLQMSGIEIFPPNIFEKSRRPRPSCRKNALGNHLTLIINRTASQEEGLVQMYEKWPTHYCLLYVMRYSYVLCLLFRSLGSCNWGSTALSSCIVETYFCWSIAWIKCHLLKVSAKAKRLGNFWSKSIGDHCYSKLWNSRSIWKNEIVWISKDLLNSWYSGW